MPSWEIAMRTAKGQHPGQVGQNAPRGLERKAFARGPVRHVVDEIVFVIDQDWLRLREAPNLSVSFRSIGSPIRSRYCPENGCRFLPTTRMWRRIRSTRRP